jgi:hypothetical protein
MRSLEPADFVGLWERGARLHPIDRALLVLACAFPDRRELARLPLGERDSFLLEVRRAILGDRLAAYEPCPSCGEQAEFEVSCSALREHATTPPTRWELEHDGVRLTLRPLDSYDAAAAVAAGEDVDATRKVLFERAVLAAERDGWPLGADELSDALAEAVSVSLAENDPGAEVLLDVACPACETSWQSVLDVAAFVWTELAAQAERLLQDVHLLARAYGWSEAQILALGDSRRTAYLAMAGA